MLGCDDALSSKNRGKGRRLPGDTWYPGSALHEQIESVPTFSYKCENMVGYRDQGKLREPTEDHRMRLIALQNRIRREIIIIHWSWQQKKL